MVCFGVAVEGLGRGPFLDIFIVLSLNLRWKSEFDDVEFTIFPCFSIIMAHLVEEDTVPTNREDETSVVEDPLPGLRPNLEIKGRVSCMTHLTRSIVRRARAEGAPANWALQIPH